MIPSLHPEGDFAMTSLGLGALTDCERCEVSEELNGSYSLELEYPIRGRHYAEIGLGSVIKAIPSPHRQAQPFYVTEINASMNGKASVYAQHISRKLEGIVMPPFSTVGISQAMLALRTQSMPAHEFAIEAMGYADESTAVQSETPINLLEAMELVRQAFGGDWEFDGLRCTLKPARGKDSGVRIQYGKNLTSLKQTTSLDNMVTGVVPYWTKKESGSTVTVVGHLTQAGSGGKTIPLDLSREFQAQPSEQQLDERAMIKLAQQANTPETSLEVEFVELASTLEYRRYRILEQCDLGDIVTVTHPAMGVQEKTRVEKVVTDVLGDAYKSVTVGQILPTMTEYLSRIIGGKA